MNKAHFFDQFAALLEAGIPIGRSLSMAGQGISEQRFLTWSRQQVEAGKPLAATLQCRHSPFTAWEIALLQVGETSGALAAASRRLAHDAAGQRRRAKLYGSIVMVLGTAAGVLLLGLVLLLGGDRLPSWALWFLVGLLALAILGKDALRLNSLGGLDHALLRHIPGFRGVVEMRSQVHLAALALPLRCGLPMDQALELIRPYLPDPKLAAAIGTAAQQARRGQPLSQSLQGKVPPTTLQMIRTGEQTGTLEALLEKLGEHYEGELERQLQRLEGSLRPFVLLALGGMVLMIGLKTLGTLLPGS